MLIKSVSDDQNEIIQSIMNLCGIEKFDVDLTYANGGFWKNLPQPVIKFDKMAKLERLIGHAVNKDDDGPVYLDELAPSRGRFKVDMPADCGFTCEMGAT
jgi:hypothetical protein